MSILSQIRLTLTSQRCLPLATWRYDPRDAHNHFKTQNQQFSSALIKEKQQLSTSTICSSNFEKLYYDDDHQHNYHHHYHHHHSTDDSKQASYKHTNGIFEHEEFYTPNSHQLGNPVQILVKELIKAEAVELLSKKHNPFKTMSLIKGLLLETFNIDNNKYKYTTSATSGPLKNLYSYSWIEIKYLLSRNGDSRCLIVRPNTFKTNSNLMSSTPYNLNDFTNKSLQNFYSNHSRDDSHSGYDKFYGHDRKSPFILVGLMGLLKSFTSSDIEEEKTKLTDEQKMKKMKPVELVIAKGVLAMCDQDYNKASDLFHKALRLAQDEDDEERETLVLNLLASNFFESGDLVSAEKLFIDLMKRMIAHDVEPTDLAILELSLKLASIYSKDQATHDKALKGFKFVINSLLNNLQDLLNNIEDFEIYELSEERKTGLALLGWSYDWFAKHLIAVNDFNGATDLLRKALEISTKVLGPFHDQTLILLNDVGTTLAMNNSPEEGMTFIKKAVKGAIESQSKELASFYVNLGLVNLKLKNLNAAKRYCEYSIELSYKHREHHNSQEVIMLSKSCLNEVERLLEVDNQ